MDPSGLISIPSSLPQDYDSQLTQQAFENKIPNADGFKDGLSLIIGFIPTIGDLKDWQEAVTGKDLITGENLSGTDRILTAVAASLPIVGGKAVREAAGILPDVKRSVVQTSDGINAALDSRRAAEAVVPDSGQFRDASGRLRDSNGRYVYDGGSSSGSRTRGQHGNTAGDQYAELYERYDADGNFLKHGVSQDASSRYTKKELNGGDIVVTDSGTSREMLAAERELVETSPGPMNHEPWAGSRAGE